MYGHLTARGWRPERKELERLTKAVIATRFWILHLACSYGACTCRVTQNQRPWNSETLGLRIGS